MKDNSNLITWVSRYGWPIKSSEQQLFLIYYVFPISSTRPISINEQQTFLFYCVVLGFFQGLKICAFFQVHSPFSRNS